MRRGVLVAVLAALLALAAGACSLSPSIAPPPPGADAITVATGSRLAYIKLPASGGKRGTPVIFLHGGPGVAEMDSDADYLSRIAAGGRDVWLYDQLGAGRSERLDDPRGYTLARAVADLEAFRAAIGAERVDLLGYSWGSTLAAAYLAAHADHVERVVFASPGRMIGGTSNLFDLLGRLDAAHLWDVLRFALEPRAFMTWILVQVNPLAAHAFTGDPAMDAQLRKILAALTPALYCRPPAEPDRTDPGFYANEMLLKPRAWRDIDPHDALRQLAIPALVIKGSCDYLSWSSATDYRDTMPQARMVYLQGAGHRAYAERPDIFFALVNAFLNGAPLPVPFETGSKPPPGFEGPVGD